MNINILLLTVFLVCNLSGYKSANNFVDSTQGQLLQDNYFSKVGLELMNNESVGFLKLGLTSSDIVKVLGEPKEKSEIVTWGADGENHQTWHYIDKGLELDMIGDSKNQVVNMICLTNPCVYKTTKNISLGNSRDDVLKAYKYEINREETGIESSSLVAGTIYGGIVFEFENNILISIFIGAAAE